MGSTIQEAMKSANLATDSQLKKARRDASYDRWEAKEKAEEKAELEDLLRGFSPGMREAIVRGRSKNKLFSIKNLKLLDNAFGGVAATTEVFGELAGNQLIKQYLIDNPILIELITAIEGYMCKLDG